LAASQEQTVNSKQQTAGSKWRTANGKQYTASIQPHLPDPHLPDKDRTRNQCMLFAVCRLLFAVCCLLFQEICEQRLAFRSQN
jgi:hypothetical protein